MIFVWSPSGTKQMSWLHLLCDQLEPEPVRDGAGLRLGLRADWEKHAAQHRAVDPPEEIRLVLGVIDTAPQLTIEHARIVSRRDPRRVDRVGLH